jgi:hypothetical protein
MLKRAFFISLMVLVVVFAVAQMGMAAYSVTFLGGPYKVYPGGEFTVEPGGGLGAVVLPYYVQGTTKNIPGYTSPETFQTFCIETNEFITQGGTYNVTLSNAAVRGGIAGGSPDPLSVGTANLYWRFATNTWADLPVADRYNYHGDAAALQSAIWWLEQEGADPNNKFSIYVKTLYGGLNGVNAQADNGGLYGYYPVAVMNLSDTNGYAQDLLTVVPIPPALYLLGSGFLGLVGIRRWRKK